MALASKIQDEEYFRVAIGQGMYTSELASNIPDGFSEMAYNLVATGDSLENRPGIRRSSVDWKVFENAAGTPNNLEAEKAYVIFPLFPTRVDSNYPAFAWSSWGRSVPSNTILTPTINFVRCAGNPGAGDGFLSVTVPDYCTGICQYSDYVYFSIRNNGVFKVTNFNWGADTITYQSIPSSANGTFQSLFTFKDRLWAFQGEVLYYTDVAPPLGYPETWAFGTNNVRFVGPMGAGRIKKVVPLGNKLLVFTSAGLFTLIVEGPPASWILKILDSKSISTTNQTAFESKGIVYYINTVGVWATNGLYNTKISGVIEDQFFLSKGHRAHSINAYEDGAIISISKLASTYLVTYDSPNCRNFYSKLDPVAWTEWNIETKSIVPTAIGKRRICSVWSLSDKIATYLNPEPIVYGLIYTTDASEATPYEPVLQLLIFDGGQDQIVTAENTIVTAPVNVYLKTKHMDGGNPYNLKQNKRGLLELFTSDQKHNIQTSWAIDATTTDGGAVRKTQTQDFTVGVGSNLVQIPAMFHYRRCGLIISTDLQSNDSQVKIKDIAIVQNTERGEFEIVR